MYAPIQFQGNFDPIQIRSSAEYDLFINIYDQLVHYGEQNEMIGGVSSQITWNDKELIFEFHNDKQTSTNQFITAKDAYYSILRSLKYQNHNLSGLGGLLCPDLKRESPQFSCSGLVLKENKLVFKLPKPHFRQFILEMLASPEYSVIPYSSIDWKQKYPEIIDYKNTTGAYYLQKDHQQGNWIFAANKYFQYYHPLMPQIIEFVQIEFSDSMKALFENKVDLLPSYFTLIDIDQIQKLKAYDYNIHETIKNTVEYLRFTKRGMSRYSLQQRNSIAQQLTKELCKNKTHFSAECTQEYFLPHNDGGLSKEQSQLINENKLGNVDFNILGNLSILFDRFTLETPAVVHHSGKFDSKLKIVNYDQITDHTNDENQYDMVNGNIEVPLSASYADLNGLFHNLDFSISGFDDRRWLNEFIQIESIPKRVKKINDFHFQILKNGVIYPYVRHSLVLATSQRWKLNLSTIKSDLQLWKLKYE